MKRWMLACFALLTMLLLVASPVAAKPADNEGPGNSGAAKQCQNGKWASRARQQTPSVAFVSENECVSYGAQGGKIVRLVVTTVDPVTRCIAEATAAGFDTSGMNIMAGTTGTDSFTLTYEPDLICGFEGRDEVDYLSEGDVFLGGDGNDFAYEMEISGGSTFIGGAGDDFVAHLYGGTFID